MAMDMRMHWIKDRVQQEQFDLQWNPGQNNLADYVTKHHSGTHHREVRPIYLFNQDLSPTTVQGCVEILNRRANKKVSKPSTEEYRILLTSTHMHKSGHNTGNNARQVTWKKELFTIVNYSSRA